MLFNSSVILILALMQSSSGRVNPSAWLQDSIYQALVGLAVGALANHFLDRHVVGDADLDRAYIHH